MYSEKNMFQRPFLHHKFHMDCPGSNPVPTQSEAGVKPSVLWHDLACIQPVYSNGSSGYFAMLLTEVRSIGVCVSRFVARGPRFECDLMYFRIVRCEPSVNTRKDLCEERNFHWTHYLPTGLDNFPAATAHTNTRL